VFDLTDKVALITGSSRGIGKAIAKRMAAAGAKVVVSSRKADACEAAAQEIRDEGGEALVVPCNVGDKAQLRNLVDATLETWGRIDTLVCNAASNPYYGPLAEIPDEAYEKTMGNNLRSNLWLCNMVLPQMAERRDGTVIIMSSVAGISGSSKIGMYGISKAADIGLVRNLAVEWGPSNVRANCIAPGIIVTDFARALWENPKIREATEKTTPLGRLGEVDDISGVAVFLASDAARYITGQTIVVDGGMTQNANM
jgi:NAD(P)-dependent dehydrogenase (short-subunit alcohol dehydrogenase family)